MIKYWDWSDKKKTTTHIISAFNLLPINPLLSHHTYPATFPLMEAVKEFLFQNSKQLAFEIVILSSGILFLRRKKLQS